MIPLRAVLTRLSRQTRAQSFLNTILVNCYVFTNLPTLLRIWCKHFNIIKTWISKSCLIQLKQDNLITRQFYEHDKSSLTTSIKLIRAINKKYILANLWNCSNRFFGRNVMIEYLVVQKQKERQNRNQIMRLTSYTD